MTDPVSEIKIDDATFNIHFQGFDVSLQVNTSSGTAVEFLPWYFSDYLSVLGRCVYPDREGVKLDGGRLVKEVFLHNKIQDDFHQELYPVALWWAVGGEHQVSEIKDSAVTLGEYEFQLRGWSAKERMDALARCLSEKTTDGLEFDFVQYIELMIRSSVVKIKPSIAIETLDAAITSELLESVTMLNVAGSLSEEIATWGSIPGLQQLLHSTLRLCKELGWGPSQIWSLPAAEIDRLIAMLDLLDTKQTKPVTHSSRFSSDPDAIVINIENDE